MAETLQWYTGKSAGSSTVTHGCVYEVLSMSAYASASFCLCTSMFAYLVCLCVTHINVTLLCRVQWCARLWAASLLPFPKLPALTHRPCWPTPLPWLRTVNAHKSFSTCLIKRQSEQVWEPGDHQRRDMWSDKLSYFLVSDPQDQLVSS